MPARAKDAKSARVAEPRASERYFELVRECPLLPIRSEAELDRAIAMLDRLLDHDDELSPEEDGYVLVLGDLIHTYETEHDPEPEIPPDEMLRYLIENKGVTQARLAADSGISEATISQILSGRRKPSRKAMTALAAYFAVDPSIFL